MNGPFDLIISANEINNHHGVGIFLQRLYGTGKSFVCVRSTTMYNGEETFGHAHHELKSRFLPDRETEARLREILSAYTIRRILCVPYYRADFVHGVLAKKLTGAPLCTYLMDDQNVFTHEVADRRVHELLAASDLRLAISPEMCAAYQKKFGLRMELLPPVLERSEPLVPSYWQAEPGEPTRAAMIGNVWTAARFEQLRALARALGLHIDWYGNGPRASWLTGKPDDWEADNIHCVGFLPEEDLVASLASYPFVIVPSGSGDDDDDNPAFSRLSLPSRLLFLHARTDTPVLVLGGVATAAGRFVTRLGTGLCAEYTVDDARIALSRMTDPTVRNSYRAAIRRWAKCFVMPDAGAWLWARLEGKDSARVPEFLPAFVGEAQPAPPWLAGIRPASTSTPTAAAPLEAPSVDDMRAFAFLRSSHLPLLEKSQLAMPPPAEVEIVHFVRTMSLYLAQRCLAAGGDILILDPHPEHWQPPPSSNLRWWQIRDMAAWKLAGFPQSRDWFVPKGSAEAAPRFAPDAFDAAISSNWLDQLQDVGELDRLAEFLGRTILPGGWNIHGSTALLHPDYFWSTPALERLRHHWQITHWPVLDDMLASDDLFFMAPQAYERYWQPSIKKSYAEFGRVTGRHVIRQTPPVTFKLRLRKLLARFFGPRS